MMIYYTKGAVELLHLIREQKKEIPIITMCEAEAQSYKYGKETYYSVIKKQIEDAFEFTAMYVDRELNLSFDDYVNLYILHPDDIAELNALNELLEHLKDDTIQKTQAPEPQPIKKFTTLQWSTIFYFVEPDLYGDIPLKKDRIHRFRLDFKLSNSKNTLSNDHNEITRVINGDEKNELKQHHINTIKAILPYLEKNYHEAFTNAIEDLSLLQDKLDRK